MEESVKEKIKHILIGILIGFIALPTITFGGSFVSSLIQGKTVEELRRAFQDSVEDYLTFCADRGEEPERPFAGRFTVRLSPEQHRRVVLAAEKAGKGIEKWMTKVVTQAAGSGTEGKSRKLSSQPLQPMRQTARRSS